MQVGVCLVKGQHLEVPILLGLHLLGTQACGETSKVIMETGFPTKGNVVRAVEILVVEVNLGTGSHHLEAGAEGVLLGLPVGDKEESAGIMRVEIAGRELHVIINTIKSCRANHSQRNIFYCTVFCPLHG